MRARTLLCVFVFEHVRGVVYFCVGLADVCLLIHIGPSLQFTPSSSAPALPGSRLGVSLRLDVEQTKVLANSHS